MKTSFLKYVVVGLVFSTTLGCESFIEDYQTDPVNVTDPTQVPLNNLLVGVQSNTIRIIEGDGARLASILSRHFSGEDRQYSGYQSYTITNSDFDDFWDDSYVDVLANAKICREAAAEAGNTRMVGLVQVHEALVYGTLADLFGDIPYTQALQYPAVTSPAYDGQASVYAAVQTLLDDAITNLGGSGNITADIFMGGSTARWIEVARTLKARFYLHTRDYNNAITNALSGVSSAANNWVFPHGTVQGGNTNLWWDFEEINRTDYLGANESFLIDLVTPGANGTGDFITSYRGHSKTDESGRLAFYFQGSKAGEDAEFNTGTGGAFAIDASFPCVTYAENQLILAEAYARTGNSANAITELNEHRAALEAQFTTGNYDAFVSADFDAAGIENVSGSLTNEQALLLEIMEERYCTFVGEFEPWNDIRRAGNPLGIPANQGTSIPERFLYPVVELTTNPNTPTGTGVGLFDPTPINN